MNHDLLAPFWAHSVLNIGYMYLKLKADECCGLQKSGYALVRNLKFTGRNSLTVKWSISFIPENFRFQKVNKNY